MHTFSRNPNICRKQPQLKELMSTFILQISLFVIMMPCLYECQYFTIETTQNGRTQFRQAFCTLRFSKHLLHSDRCYRLVLPFPLVFIYGIIRRKACIKYNCACKTIFIYVVETGKRKNMSKRILYFYSLVLFIARQKLSPLQFPVLFPYILIRYFTYVIAICITTYILNCIFCLLSTVATFFQDITYRVEKL